jgi:2-aminoethylphosphonate transport system ATP-binding protein
MPLQAGPSGLTPSRAADQTNLNVVTPPCIGLRGVTVRYGQQTALHPLDLDVANGEVLVLLGPSGSGKTTLLRAIAGFCRLSGGQVELCGRDVTNAPPHARGLGMVVQSYALFPHMRVAENVAFGLEARSRPRTEIERAVRDGLAMVGMTDYARRYPRELSGGQQQRVAMARALAIRPQVLLLDEPLSALDAPLRADMLEEIRRLHAQLPDMAIVYVTHDQTEAISLGHRIVLMRDGRVAALGTPRNLHDTPPNRYAAEFFGQANLLPVALLSATSSPQQQADNAPANTASHAAVMLDGQVLWARKPVDLPPGKALLCIRPHDLHLGAQSPGTNRVDVRVESVHWMGAVQRLRARLGTWTLRVDLPGGQPAPGVGDIVALVFHPQRATVLADT